jgi:phosphonate transport system permease protein
MLAVAAVLASLRGIGFSASSFLDGLPHMGRILAEMSPPSLERAGPVAKAILETFQMALVGTVAGVVLSLPLAVLATRHLSPNAVIYHAARLLIAVFRTVPDLVWALSVNMNHENLALDKKLIAAGARTHAEIGYVPVTKYPDPKIGRAHV